MSKRILVEPVEGRENLIDVLEHPIDGMLKAHGTFWTYDAFTCQMLKDKVISTTGETDQTPQKEAGPEAIMQQRRVAKPRARMRIHNPPAGR